MYQVALERKHHLQGKSEDLSLAVGPKGEAARFEFVAGGGGGLIVPGIGRVGPASPWTAVGPSGFLGRVHSDTHTHVEHRTDSVASNRIAEIFGTPILQFMGV